MAMIHSLIESIALAIEMLGVLVIAGSVLLALSPRRLLRARAGADALSGYKQRMGKGLLLGLELLLAADIIATVGLDFTIESLLALGLLVLIRSFLSWSLEVEIEGCWPWRVRKDIPELTAGEESSAAVKAPETR